MVPILWLLTTQAVTAAITGGDTSWYAHAWQADSGLPNNTVNSIAQTPDGYLWIATESGLARFDGVQFHDFALVNAAGTASSLIYAVMVDHQGRLWVAKDRGVVVCINGMEAFSLTQESGLKAKEVRTIVEDKDGAVWMSYIGSDVVRIVDRKVRAFTGEDGVPDGNTCQIATDNSGQLWFARGVHLGVVRNGRFLSLATTPVQRIAAAKGGGMWIGSQHHIRKYQEGGEVTNVIDLPVTGPSVNPTAVLEDRNGGLWVGTRERGLFYFDGVKVVPVKTSHREILSLLEDQEGNLWAGTRGGGLNRIQPRWLEMVDVSSGLPFEGVRSACEDSAGDLWAVTQRGGLTRNHDGVWRELSTNEGWTIRNSQCVSPAADGGVWVGNQYRGMFRWRNGVDRDVSTKQGLVDNCIGSLLSTESGDVWIASAAVSSLQRWNDERLETFVLPPDSGLVNAMAWDSQSNLWAGTSSGVLVRVHNGTVVDETHRLAPSTHAIRCLSTTPSGELWIGYEGGCAGRLKGSRYAPFTTEQGLRDEYVFQIASDGCGRLWFAGNRGIFCAREDELNAVADGRATRAHSVGFGQDDGLPSLQASHAFWPGAFRARDGRVWIPTLTGMAVVRPRDLPGNPQPPRVLIERVVVDGNTIAANQLPDASGAINLSPLGQADESQLELSPDHRQLGIEFAAPCFTSPRNVAFKYKLEGLDTNWVPAGDRRMAYYTRIAPGDYVFRVAACNEQGAWNEAGAGFKLRVLPHIWEKWWFRIGSSLLLLAVVGGVVRYFEIQKMQRKVELAARASAVERERARIAQDLHDDLGAGLTQISLNSALAQNPSVPPSEAGGMLQEIDQRARELVTALDEIVWAVNPRNDTVPSLARYLCQYAQSSVAPAGIACRLEVAPDLAERPLGAEQRHNLFLAFKEALHNAMRHSDAKEIRIEIRTEPNALSIVLADNGCGFSTGISAEGADGLGNMRARMERLGGTSEFASVPGQGTTVRFRLPLPAEEGGIIRDDAVRNR